MKAVLVLIAVVGLVGFKWVSAAASLPTDGRAALEQWVQLEFQRAALDNSTLDVQQLGDALLETVEIRIAEMSARGTPDDLVVRVELEPGPAIPPGESTTRYYRMEYSTLTGWRTPSYASALRYALAWI